VGDYKDNGETLHLQHNIIYNEYKNCPVKREEKITPALPCEIVRLSIGKYLSMSKDI